MPLSLPVNKIKVALLFNLTYFTEIIKSLTKYLYCHRDDLVNFTAQTWTSLTKQRNRSRTWQVLVHEAGNERKTEHIFSVSRSSEGW